jgi:hypothetical protein
MARSSLPSLEGDFGRALLRSAERDEPSQAAYTKAAATLGVGVGLALSASLPAPAVLAAGAAELAGAARWSSSLIVRLAAFGVSAALLLGAGLFLRPARSVGGLNAHGLNASAALPLPAREATKHLRPANPVESVAAEGSALASSAPEAPAPAPALVLPTRSALPSSGVTRKRRLSRASAAQRETSRSSLSEQVQSLDRARVALGSSDAGTALREIAHYRSVWPKGVFLTEASVLEIEALAARGERSLAASRAASFVAAHPDSPQAERLRSLIPLDER